MARECSLKSTLFATAALWGLTTLIADPATAQDLRPRHRHTVSVQHVATTTTSTAYRGLTINRSPGDASSGPEDNQDIYRDGPIRYNDIRDFSPSPYTTSGVEYPFGFDGIGGYGSDLGFGAGQDTALYNRGAGWTR